MTARTGTTTNRSTIDSGCSLKHQDFPALHKSADALSNSSQGYFFLALGLHVICLITAAALSVLNSPEPGAAVAQGLVMLLAFGCSIYLATKRPDKLWYRARAVAESVKTLSWRYVCRAEPFDTDDVTARTNFRSRLQLIANQNSKVVERMSEHLGDAQVSEVMERMRSADHDTRVKVYAEDRIQDQQNWYVGKQKTNARRARWSFGLLIVANALAVVFALLKIKYPAEPFWPTDLFLAIAGALLIWMQARRYSELSASYAVAATDISLFRDKLTAGISEADFSLFVSDAENAFSREHTLWVARQDA